MGTRFAYNLKAMYKNIYVNVPNDYPYLDLCPTPTFDLDLFPKVTAAALIFPWSEFQKTDNLPPYPVHLILYQF